MSKLTWIIFSVIVAGLLVTLVVASRSGNPAIDVSNVDANTVQPASDMNGNIADHVYGKSDSKVLLIEYGDFQCPGCGKAHPRIKAIVETYKDQIGFVFRNFPLTSIHPNARAAAGAAEAAGLQNKYWEMHDQIFETQSAWENLTGTERANIFTSYASTLGLDSNTFTKDLDSNAIGKKISFDQALAKKVSVDSTPTFFLNGVKLSSDVWGDDTALKAAIDTELKKAGITPPVVTE